MPGTKLPNAHRAIIDLSKLRDYALSPLHAEGQHKARVFGAALDLTREDANWLGDQLRTAIRLGECQLSRRTEHGQRYVLDFTVTRGAKSALVRSVWNVRPSEDFPRLVTCYVI